MPRATSSTARWVTPSRRCGAACLPGGAVGRMALAPGAELDQVHCLAGVQVEQVADPIAEAERVGGRLGHSGSGESLVLGPRDLQRALVLGPHPRLADLVGDSGTQV